MSSVWLFQNNRLLLNGNTSDTAPEDHYFHYIFYNMYLACFFKCNLHHIFDSYKYILVFLNGRKSCFWPQNKARSLCIWLWGWAVCGVWNSFKNKYCHIDGSRRCNFSNNTLCHLKYVKKCNPPMFFKCNISVNDRYACIYEQFIFLSSFVFAH